MRYATIIPKIELLVITPNNTMIEYRTANVKVTVRETKRKEKSQ